MGCAHSSVNAQGIDVLSPPGSTKKLMAGGVGSIDAGRDASLMRQAIYGTARIGLHRTFSDIIAEKTGGQVPFWMKTLSGMASGSIAVCIGTPMDVALVRMQSDSMKPVAERRNYAHVLDAMGRTASEEGFGALYKGASSSSNTVEGPGPNRTGYLFVQKCM